MKEGSDMKELEDLRDRIVLATLPHVAFEGWSDRAIRVGWADSGLPEPEAALIFTGGAAEMVEHWSRYADRRMTEAMARPEIVSMDMRQRIAAAVRFRLEVNVPYREAVRRTLSYLALPANAPLAARCAYQTVNSIWYACGDTSTDIAFYTKRVTLVAVYGATVLYWLDDSSDGFTDTWAFLDRCLSGTGWLPKLKERLRTPFGGLFRPCSPRTRDPHSA